jgi:DNA-binding MarR family transcriptional regulator
MYKTLRAFQAGINYLRKEVFTELPAQHITIFLAVVEADGITQFDLSQNLKMPQGSLSRNLKRLSSYYEMDSTGKNVLQGLGLLENRSDLYDRKRLAIWLTPKGRKVMEGLASVMAKEVGE